MNVETIVAFAVFGFAIACFIVWMVLTLRESYVRHTHTFVADGFKVSSRKIDRSTGLPKLPPGWFWRLREDDDDDGYGSNWMVLETVDASGNVRHEETMLKSSAVTTQKAFKSRLLSEARDSIRSLSSELGSGFDYTSFYGSYPPKNINKV